MGLIVPVLPRPMSVDLRVHSCPAWHGSRHVGQLGRDGGRSHSRGRFDGTMRGKGETGKVGGDPNGNGVCLRTGGRGGGGPPEDCGMAGEKVIDV